MADPIDIIDVDFPPGTLIADRYRVERVIGRGGMGTVVAARHIELDELFAVKLMRVDNQEHRAEMLARFRREARVSAKVRHDRVMRVFDAGRLGDDTPYMVMELLKGEDLGYVLERQHHIESVEAVDLALKICEGLAAIHAAGVVHRDLKPENIFLEKRGDGTTAIKILDFGIAKLDDAKFGPQDQKLTIASGAMGTPPYMAPEQVTAPDTADARADIWAVGTVLYVLLTGRDAFASGSQHDSMLHILTATPVSVRTHQAAITADLDAVVARCLSKKPEDRFANVAELAQALAPFGSPGANAVVRRVISLLGVSVSVAPASIAPTRKRPATLTPLTTPSSRVVASMPPDLPKNKSSRGYIALGVLAALLLVAIIWGPNLIGSTDVHSADAASGEPEQVESPVTETTALPPTEPATLPSSTATAEPDLTSVVEQPLNPKAKPIPATAPTASTSKPETSAAPKVSAAPPPPGPPPPPSSEGLFDDRK